MVDSDRLSAAFATARCDLVAESATAGHWIGELSSSPLATATAISALTLVERHAPSSLGHGAEDEAQCRCRRAIVASLRWLARRQNSDGGWGDTVGGPSNIAATMLARAAFALTCVPADQPGLLERADAYIKSQGSTRALRRYCAGDRTLAAAILANTALAGLVPWRKVPALRPELSCFPRWLQRLFGVTVVGRDLPAHVALGQARRVHRRSWNPLARLARRYALAPSLRALESLQPADGGFLAAVPLTSFVVMGLVSSGRADHPVVHRAVPFLLEMARADGSWPLAANLSIRATALAVNALADAGEAINEPRRLDWLLSTLDDRETEAGEFSAGWSWTDRSGGVITVEDTAEVLLALAAYLEHDLGADRSRIVAAANRGIGGLLAAQSDGGGWTSFGRDSAGWLEPGASDVTAQALRALGAWQRVLSDSATPAAIEFGRRISAATDQGFRFLAARQHADGYWTASCFGNSTGADRGNPIIGTARVLAAYHDLRRAESPSARRALDWLAAAKAPDGGWGGHAATNTKCPARPSSVEETAAAAEALLVRGTTALDEAAAQSGIAWLVDAVEANRHEQPAAIGLYFGPLWYDEKVYPLVGCVAALGRAAGRLLPQTDAATALHPVKT